MLSFIKRNKKKDVFTAFTKGKTIAIEKVGDPVFATKMMGDGMAILPKTNEICAPCDAEVILLMQNTKHAVGLRDKNGIEILLHVGLDTVDLHGKGFTYHVQEGQRVKQGDLLITFDKQILKEHGYSDVTIMVITDSQQKNMEFFDGDLQVELGDTIAAIL